MNEIIKKLLDWCHENDFCIDIDLFGKCGSIWLILKLSYGNKHMNHSFYIPGGVMCKENWNEKCSRELDLFLCEAKEKLKL